MNDIKIFSNSEFGKIRTVTKDSEVWFCLKDICKALEINNATDVKSRLSEGGVDIIDLIDNLGRKQQATFINESNLYKTIFQSRKPNAERFTDWVTSEVLPSIRKSGGYIVGQNEMSNEELLAKALMVAQNLIADKERLLAEKQERIEQMKPKEVFADAVTTSKTSILVGEFAKILKQNGIEIGQKRLFEWLRRNGYLIKGGSDYNMPTQKSMELGLFEIKEGCRVNSCGVSVITRTPKITGKGQVYFTNKFLRKSMM